MSSSSVAPRVSGLLLLAGLGSLSGCASSPEGVTQVGAHAANPQCLLVDMQRENSPIDERAARLRKDCERETSVVLWNSGREEAKDIDFKRRPDAVE